MTDQSKKPPDHRPSLLLSLVIFLVMTGLMAYVRLFVFRDHMITLTYGLPLLVCL